MTNIDHISKYNRSVIIFGAPFILVAMIMPHLVFASNCCFYPSNGDNPKADNAFEKGLDAGTVMAQQGDAPPTYDDCVQDGGNQAQYGQYVSDFCNGTIQGFEAFGK